jgi:hypothetical protein
MAEPNYGPSAASLATAAASAYDESSTKLLADINADIARTATEMNDAIVRGMSPEEQAGLNQRLSALTQRAKAVIESSQGAYQYAQEQSTAAANLYSEQMQQAQAAQRQLAAQAFGQSQAVPTPGGYDRFSAEGGRAIRESAGATMAAIGGEASVPSGLLPNVPGLVTPGRPEAAGGLVGVSLGGAQLFNRALNASQARALAELQGQQLALATQLELSANEAAREREEKERDRVAQYKISALLSAQGIAAQIGSTRAELLAKAAGSDTRTGKQIAQAELDAYDKKSAIDWKYTQKQIAAQAKSQGLSKEDTAMLQMQADEVLGGSTIPGRLLNNALKIMGNLPTNSKTGEILGALPGDKGKWYLDAGVLLYDRDGNGKATPQPVQIDQIIRRVNAKLGQISTLPKNKQAEAWGKFWDDTTTGLGDAVARRALAIITSAPDALNQNWYFELLTKGTAGTGRTLTPAAEAAADQRRADKLPPVSPTPSPSPGPRPTPTQPVRINPSAQPKDVSEARNVIEASKLAEAGARQPERFALPNGVNVNVFTYKGKRYASPIGSTAEVYEWNDAKKSLGKRV